MKESLVKSSEFEFKPHLLAEFLCKQEIYCIGWDVDGTLVNTTAIYERAMDEASSQILFNTHLRSLKENQLLRVRRLREDMRTVINGTRKEFGTHPRIMAWAVHIAARSQAILPGSDRYLKARQEIDKIHNGLCPDPYPGAVETVKAFEQTGVSQIIATHAGRDWTERKIKHMGLNPNTFDQIICMDVTRPKEEQWQESLMPEANHRHIDPQHLLFIGDNPKADIQGTRQLGAKCVFINHRQQQYPEFEADPDIWVVTRISEIIPTLTNSIC